MESQDQIATWGSEDCLTSTSQLTEFVKGLIPRQSHAGREMRTKARQPFVAEIRVQKVDRDYQAAGSEFAAVTRDISVSGLCLIAPVLVDTALVIVRIDHPSGVAKRLLMEVRRCRPFRKYFEVGGSFVTDMS